MGEPLTHSSRSGKKGRKARSKPRMILFGIVGLLLLGCLSTAGYAGYLYFFKLDDVLEKIGTEEKVPAGMSAKVKPISILLLGLDSRPETGSLNTDVIMAAALNPETKSATVVSIPRDTYIGPQFGLRGNKANAFYPNLYISSRDTAQANIKEVFGGVLNIPFDYVVVVNFQAFRDTVDTLGGITVDVDMDMRYVDKADGTDINLKEGVQQKLSGKEALDFVRYRKSNNNETAESGDMERNTRQQLVVAAVLDKLKSPSGLLKLGDVLNAIADNVESDMPAIQMKDTLRTYIGIDQDKIQYIHLQGEWKSPYVRIAEEDWEEAGSALQEMLK